MTLGGVPETQRLMPRSGRVNPIRHATILCLVAALAFDFVPLSNLRLDEVTRLSPILFVGLIVLAFIAVTNPLRILRPFHLAAALLLLGYLISAVRFDFATDLRSLVFIVRLGLLIVLAVAVYQVVSHPRMIRFTYKVLFVLLVAQTVFSLVQFIRKGTDPPPFLTFYEGWGGSNLTGLYLAVLVALTISLSVFADISKRLRLLLVTMSALFSLALLLTMSRGAMVSLIVAMIAYLLVSRRIKLGLVAVLIAGSVILCVQNFQLVEWPVESPLTREAFNISVPPANRKNAIRVGLAMVAFRMLAYNPIQGIGPGKFDEAKQYFTESGDPWYLQLVLEEPHYNAHIQPLVTWTEGGVVAFLGLAVLLLFVTKKLYRAARCMSPVRPYALAAIIGWFVMLVEMIVTFPLELPFFWFMLGLWLATANIAAQSKMAHHTSNHPIQA